MAWTIFTNVRDVDQEVWEGFELMKFVLFYPFPQPHGKWLMHVVGRLQPKFCRIMQVVATEIQQLLWVRM